MSTNTGIEWTDATWNPTRGCSRVSPGCVNCYAERTAMRQIHDGYKGLVHIVNGHPAWTGKVVMAPESTLLAPLRWRKPRRIFVNSMSDLFHEDLSDADIDRVFAVMALCPQHTFQVLTKRPERMLKYLGTAGRSFTIEMQGWSDPTSISRPIQLADWPLPNVWLGVSVEDQKYADERIPLLLQTPAAVRFVSYEPALGPVSFRWMCAWPENAPTTAMNPSGKTDHLDGLRRLDWIVVGGESGPGARPFDIAWARDTVEQCKAAGVACFVKQLGAKPFKFASKQYLRLFEDRKGGNMTEWPEDLRVREFPQIPRAKKDQVNRRIAE